MKIISDGPEKLRDATKEQKVKRKEEIRAELLESVSQDLSEAGFFLRLLIRYRLRIELMKRLKSEFPQSGCLHLVPQK
jgi:hypothetical protein